MEVTAVSGMLSTSSEPWMKPLISSIFTEAQSELDYNQSHTWESNAHTRSISNQTNEFEFQPLLLSKKPQGFPGNKPVVSSQEIQDQSYSSPVQVTNVLATIESNDNTRNRLGDDKISDDDTLACFTFLCNIMKRCAMMTRPPQDRASISFGEEQLEETQVSSLISASPDRAFISFGDKQLEKTLIEQEVRKDVNRKSVKSILDTEARIWGWRQAIRSISSKPGFSNEYSSDPLFLTAVMTKGLGMNHPGISRFEEPSRVLVSSQNHQYHVNQVQNPSGRHVVSPTTPQRSLLAFAPPDTPLGVVDDTSSSTVVVASNVATFSSTSPVEAEPATPPVTTSELTTTNLVTLTAPISNSLTNEVEGNVSGSTFEALDTGSRFEKGDTSQRTRGGRLIKRTQKVLEMQSTLARRT
ncbi:hypothetical protein Bca4012_087835 [Brassica carinata]